MITRRDLIRALQQQDRKIADWVVVERAQEIAIHHGDTRRRERRTRFTLVAHHDAARGRGSARLDLTAAQGESAAVVEHAYALAASAIGTAWESARPAAPAKVNVLDPALAGAKPIALDARAAELVADATAAAGNAGVTLAARATVMREQVWVHAKSGFHHDWIASVQRLDATVATADHSLAVVREDRTKERLAIGDAIDEAARDLKQLAAAVAMTPERYAVVLGTDALLHGGGYGIWQVFAAQADAVVERQGITRYRLDTPIVPGADGVPYPLSIASDGALPEAVLSAPVGEEGHSIRRFPLVERGRCIGLGLSAREAALRRKDPNGGVRNLVVTGGAWNGELSEPRTLVVRRLRSLVLDPLTGDASLEILLAVDRTGAAVTGGTIRLDVVAAFAHASRSTAIVKRGPYQGPTAVLIPEVAVIV